MYFSSLFVILFQLVCHFLLSKCFLIFPLIWDNVRAQISMCDLPNPEGKVCCYWPGGGTPINGLCGYVPLNRVCFLLLCCFPWYSTKKGHFHYVIGHVTYIIDRVLHFCNLFNQYINQLFIKQLS